MQQTEGGEQMSTVLLIDDEPAVVKAISRVFEAHDWDVVAASNGTKAVALSHERCFDLVLCDVIMDGLVGRPLLDALRGTRGCAEASIVLMSAMPERRVRGLIPGDYGFIGKPFDFEELTALLYAPAASTTPRRQASGRAAAA